jgi:tight adherence protein B
MQTLSGHSWLITLLLVLTASLLVLLALYMMWQTYKGPGARQIEKRLLALSASRDNTDTSSLLKERMFSQVPALERIMLNLPRVQRLDQFILQAGLEWTVGRLLLLSLAFWAAALALLTVVLNQPLLLAAALALAPGGLPWLYVARRRGARLKRFEQQLPEALDLMVRALRSGHAFASALQMVGEEMPEPAAGEFRIVHDEVNFGVAMPQALANLAVRVPLTDLRYFVVAVQVQRESGGNLTELLGNLSRLIRERLKLLARVRVLSSEGRLSAWVLGLMPFALAGLMSVVSPTFISLLWTDPIGVSIVKTMLFLMLLGVLLLRKIVRIHI